MYYCDKPISTNADDLLDRSSFSGILANALVNLKSDDTFTVGLFGKWGTGKTSIVNMTLEEISQMQLQDDEKPIVIHFEPWHFTDSTQLLNQFLIRMANEFKSKGIETLDNIGKALEKYSGAFSIAEIIPTPSSPLATLGKKGFSFLGKKMQIKLEDKDILGQKEYVIKLLKQQKRRILVVIDDIDRLSNEQIRQVFQMVSSVAKFPNTIYLLVFDKEIVAKALEKVQEGEGEEYLEKVIQMPIQIPQIQESKLHATLFARLDMVIKSYPDAFLNQEHWRKIFHPCVAPFIKNLRDINRLCNSLRFKLTAISSEVDIGDMIAISAIEIGIPQIYQWIKDNKNLLTNNDVFFALNSRDKNQNEWFEHYKAEISNLFNNTESNSNISAKVEVGIKYLCYLFPSFGQKVGKPYTTLDSDNFRKNCFVAHPDKFDRYFYLDIESVGIRRALVQKAVTTFNSNDFIKLLIEEDGKGKSIEFIKEMKALIDDISSDRAKILITSFMKARNFMKDGKNNYLAFDAQQHCDNLCLKLLYKVKKEERLALTLAILKCSDKDSMNSITGLIFEIELAHGRISSNVKNEEYQNLLDVDELLKFEVAFCEQIKNILKEISLFDFTDWYISLQLLKSIDAEYVQNYLESSLKDNKNIVRYIEESVSIMTSNGEEKYEISNEYSNFLTEERIVTAILQQRDSGKLFDLPERNFKKCVAFYLNTKGKYDFRGRVTQTDVDNTIEKWRSGIYDESET